MKVIKAVIISIMVCIFLIGFAILVFPFINNIVVDNQLKQESEAFFERLEFVQPITDAIIKEDPTMPIEPTSPSREYEALWDAMQAYNHQLWAEKQAGLCDPWAYQQPSFTLGEYGLNGEVFGVIRIPSLNLEMPLYLGATAAHMAMGAAHLSQTSLPIGGNNTNCVIAGHRGYNGADYFRYVTNLKPGDEVIITNLWEALTYTVSYTDIIQPNDVEKILIQDGKDMVTLLTCHPYASGGNQRFLVFCDRIMND